MRGVVFGNEPRDVHRAGRTERSLAAAGIGVAGEPALTTADLAARLREAATPVLLAQAGAWLGTSEPLPPFPASATGRPLIGFGAIRGADAWSRFLARSGGDFQRRPWLARSLPAPALVFLEGAVLAPLATLLEGGHPLRVALQRLIRERRFRAVHLHALDAHVDAGLRVIQLVTTIQVGGAERVTLDLAEELSRQGVAVCVAALGAPARLAYPRPACFADLSGVPNPPDSRARAVAELALEFGADLVHGHLISAAEARGIRARGLPLAMTLHNMPTGWPAGLDVAHDAADVIFTCARAVEAEWRKRPGASSSRVRTIWNGIDAGPFAPTEKLRVAARAWRAERGWSAADFVIAAVANPRPQKRLHLLPPILREVQKLIAPRVARLVIAGAHVECSAEARRAVEETEAAIAHCGVAANVHWTGATAETPTILAASDACVSTSAFEGLSLAHLEALAAGVPIVATDVGGTGEIAGQSSLFHLLPAESGAREFATVLAGFARERRERSPELPGSFLRYQMAARTRLLYPRVIECSRPTRRGDELWLIANNFSTGGAQSSARRLLIGLAERGVKVRVFTVQEEPGRPTPGHAALLRAGITVEAIAPPADSDAAQAVGRILDRAALSRPHAVLFWNLIASYKILLADALFDTPIFDVSPGEMFFSALAKYFAQPRHGLPYRTPADYGERLAGVVVKYSSECDAAAALGAPVHIIPNGVALRSRVDAPRRHSHDVLIIGTMARLSPDKRLEELLEAFRLAQPRMPRCELRIAGGSERGMEDYSLDLRRRARGMPVTWCGELSDTTRFLEGLDLFAMISEPAGCPNALLEAMACGLAVVATDAGGASEQVIDERTGRLTPRADPAAFAEALVDLAGDDRKRGRLGAAAAAHMLEKFSLEKMIESYRALCFGE